MALRNPLLPTLLGIGYTSTVTFSNVDLLRAMLLALELLSHTYPCMSNRLITPEKRIRPSEPDPIAEVGRMSLSTSSGCECSG
jgi:hypothetical protein